MLSVCLISHYVITKFCGADSPFNGFLFSSQNACGQSDSQPGPLYSRETVPSTN